MLILSDSFARYYAAFLAVAAPVPALAQSVDVSRPEIKLLLQYVETLGKLEACGPREMEDRTNDIVNTLADHDVPGTWNWLNGSHSAYVEELQNIADRQKLLALSEICQITPLQDSYRTLARSIERSLLDE